MLLASMIPARAATRLPDRVVVGTYTQPRGVSNGTWATMLREPSVVTVSRADEDRVTVTSTTRMGRLVALAVDVTPPGKEMTRRITCVPLAFHVLPKTRIAVTPMAGRCPDGRLATPSDGTVRLSFHRVPPKLRSAPPEMRWAVVIGISDYAGRTHSTIGGRGDAIAVKTALLAAGWRSDHVYVLTESQATAANIRAAMDWLAKVSTPRTFSLLHFSGHVCIASRGPCASGHTYLWSHDNRFIPDDEVRTRMRRVQGYSWLDVAGCEAGAFAMWSPTRMFSGSSQASETSYEYADWHQSVFAGLVWDRGFMRGLADPQGKAKHATIGQMTAYAKAKAPVMTRKHPAGPQHPVVKGGSTTWTLYAPPGG
jgi:hypothetical protein